MRRCQHLLIKSWHAKVLAVRTVTQDNKGKKTAGIDAISSLTPNQRLGVVAALNIPHKAKPLRRV